MMASVPRTARRMCFFMTLAVWIHPSAADNPGSLALRRSLERQRFSLALSDNSYSRLWDAIELRNKANSGNPFAQHELGLRYLTGRDYAPDSVKAAHWIKRAADQNLLSARYNMGILQNNGWGVPWNPFEAYRHFQYAANHGMPEAQYVFGMLLTDNLIVGRNDFEAIRWIKMSADSGFAPARETLAELRKRGLDSVVDSPADPDREGPDSTTIRTSGANPFLGFEAEPSDTAGGAIGGLTDENPMKEFRSGKVPEAGKNDAGAPVRARALKSVRDAAKAGNPEALTLLGRLTGSGDGSAKDELLAAYYYLLAIRNNSPRAAERLAELIRREGFLNILTGRAGRNDPVAQYVWAGLVALGFDRQLNDGQALQLLEASAAQKCAAAVVELGLYYYSGKWVARDRARGKSLLRQAADAGDREASIRLWMIGLGEEETVDRAALVDSLRKADRDGSLLAQTMIGYCYHKGIGVKANPARSVEYYRRAYQRGSLAAYNALRDIYDEIRPDDPEFRIPE
jgi:uncharacterized protein